MTDNEIIKALECCIEGDCDNCPWDEQTACNEYMKQDALDLINRQKANAEGLTNAVRVLNEQLSSAKAEIERLTAFKSYFDELYGKGLDIANWHKNGDLEPFDSFYNSALEEMAGEG